MSPKVDLSGYKTAHERYSAYQKAAIEQLNVVTTVVVEDLSSVAKTKQPIPNLPAWGVVSEVVTYACWLDEAYDAVQYISKTFRAYGHSPHFKGLVKQL